MTKVITYIDGFNLYFGLRSKYGRKYLWLDIVKLSRLLLREGQTLEKVKYFTSRIKGNSVKMERQATYLNALASIQQVNLYFGKYFINKHKCPICGNIEHIPTEKMTDVNIATHLLVDGYENSYDVAILISADSDLKEPVEQIRRLFPEKKIIVAFPPDRDSAILRRVAGAFFRIGRVKFEKSQLPQIVITSSGLSLKRPDIWK